jgi:hypothetical protein
MMSRSAVCAAPIACGLVLDFERRLLRVVHHPEKDGIDVRSSSA